MVTKVIVYSFLMEKYIALLQLKGKILTKPGKKLNYTVVAVYTKRFLYLCVTYFLRQGQSTTRICPIRVISFMNSPASHETAEVGVLVSLFVVFSEFPIFKDGILLFHSCSFCCLSTQMTSLKPEKQLQLQYNQIPSALDSQNKYFFCPIILWKAKQLERELVPRLYITGYKASCIFLPYEQLVTFWFLEAQKYLKLLKQGRSYYGVNLLTYLGERSDQFYFVFPEKMAIAK